MKLLSASRLLLAVLLLAACALPAAGQNPTAAPILPDPKLTPGDTLDVSLTDIQERGYSAKVRNVPIAVKRDVYNSYGIQSWGKGEFEMDHLISLSLGGSNSKKNLWPQSYQTEPWNAHTKDQLEYKLLQLVRSGQVDLHTAQQEMAHNWIAAYKKYVSPVPIVTEHRGMRHPRSTGYEHGDTTVYEDEKPDTDTTTAPQLAGSTDVASRGQVWVNTKSGVIWKPASRYYGKTKVGEYMAADEALRAGYHYANGTGN